MGDEKFRKGSSIIPVVVVRCVVGEMLPDVTFSSQVLLAQLIDTQPGRSLRERLRTHKVFTKDQCFYLNNHKFSIKSYVLDVY